MNDTVLYCPACDRGYDPALGLLSCPEAGDGREHALERRLHRIGLAQCREAADMARAWTGGARDPLTAFSCLGLTARLAGKDAHAGAAAALREALVAREGRPLAPTPLVEVAALAEAVGHAGTFRVKDETGQIAGSHKVRHLAGAMLWIQAADKALGRAARPELAISSCGNAALAAAVVARAAGYALRAFVPEDVPPGVVDLLAQRDARVEIVPRHASGLGDPCYLAFRRAVTEQGCLPFCCSGRDNWAGIEGGQSLGYETALQWAELGGQPRHLIVQVGGGALARSVATAFGELAGLGVIDRAPLTHVCQAEGCFPFVRAYLLLLAEIASRAGLPFPLSYDRAGDPGDQLARLVTFQNDHFALIADAARHCANTFQSEPVRQTLALAAGHPARFLWPWDGDPPHSLAHGILDDETYDWFALARALLSQGSVAVVVEESRVAEAEALALGHTAMSVSATGSSGLAGYLALRRLGVIAPEDSVGLFFTGTQR